MNTFEKSALVIIAVLLIGLVAFSYHEFTESPKESSTERSRIGFADSRGQDFKIGPFTTLVNEQTSNVLERGCEALQPEIIGTLHDIKERLEAARLPTLSAPAQDTFEVNEPVLELFCHTTAHVTLADERGNHLLLEKLPFTRAIPAHGKVADIGTEVKINATVIPVGALPPLTPTVYGYVLIPDRFLDTTASSSP